MSMILAIETALKTLTEDSDQQKRDIAVKHLARQYAASIDEAEQVEIKAAAILREIRPWCDPALYNRIEAVYSKSERAQGLASLGPKLQSALVELGMTRRARADAKKKAGAGSNGQAADNSPLAKARAAYKNRVHGA